MASTAEWRKQFTKYKADVKKRGKPFYPYAMFHDTVMSLVVVSVIIAGFWSLMSGTVVVAAFNALTQLFA